MQQTLHTVLFLYMQNDVHTILHVTGTTHSTGSFLKVPLSFLQYTKAFSLILNVIVILE